jgi:Zn-dependent protease
MVLLIAKMLTFIRVLGSLQIQASPWATIPGLILWSWSDSLFGTFGGIAAFLVLVSSLVIHELGHIALAAANNVPVQALGFSPAGSYIKRASAKSPLVELGISIAGPMASMLLAILFLAGSSTISRWLGSMNLIIAGSNLLPVRGCDGHRAWVAMRKVIAGS